MVQKRTIQNKKTVVLVETAVCTAIIAVLSQISIPFIAGIPITLQTLAVALTGFILGKKNGTISMVVYVLLGLVGIPVFAQFTCGAGILFGISGGYIFGFIGMVFLCGLSEEFEKYPIKILLSLSGLAFCHLFGVFQFAFVAKCSVWQALMIASVPYIVKDAISVALAYWVSKLIKKALKAGGISI